jgi:hypothetical protein
MSQLKRSQMGLEKEGGRQISPFLSFLWWCSGATPSLLKKWPIEWSKYGSIGASVLTTSLLAAVSGGYAVYSISRSTAVASIFGVVWGLMLFVLDRFIVSTLSKADELRPPLAAFTEQLLKALPRLILAIFISIVIAAPLRIAFFENEIQQKIYQEQGPAIDETKQKIALTEAKIANLNESLRFESQRLEKLSDSYLAELAGRVGTNSTGIPGVGPVYRQRLLEFRRAEEEFRVRKTEIERELTQKTSELAALKNREDDLNRRLLSSQSSFVSKWEALSSLAKSDRRIALAGYLLTFLIILLDASPVLLKLLTPRGPYDDAMSSASRSLEDEPSQSAHKIDAELRQALNQALDRSFLKEPKKS